MYPYKFNKYYDDKNQKSYQKRPIDIFYFSMETVYESRDKINVIEHNRVIKKKMFRLSLQVSKLYIIFGPILQLLKDPTVPRYWAKLTGIGYKE